MVDTIIEAAWVYLGICWGDGVNSKFGKIAIEMFMVGYDLIIVAGLIALFLRSGDIPIFLLSPLAGC